MKTQLTVSAYFQPLCVDLESLDLSTPFTDGPLEEAPVIETQAQILQRIFAQITDLDAAVSSHLYQDIDSDDLETQQKCIVINNGFSYVRSAWQGILLKVLEKTDRISADNFKAFREQFLAVRELVGTHIKAFQGALQSPRLLMNEDYIHHMQTTLEMSRSAYYRYPIERVAMSQKTVTASFTIHSHNGCQSQNDDSASNGATFPESPSNSPYLLDANNKLAFLKLQSRENFDSESIQELQDGLIAIYSSLVETCAAIETLSILPVKTQISWLETLCQLYTHLLINFPLQIVLEQDLTAANYFNDLMVLIAQTIQNNQVQANNIFEAIVDNLCIQEHDQQVALATFLEEFMHFQTYHSAEFA